MHIRICRSHFPPEWWGGQTQGSCLEKSWRLASPSSLRMAVILGKALPPLGLFFLLREGFAACLWFFCSSLVMWLS